MPVKFDTKVFHEANNKMTLVKVYLEILDEKIAALNPADDVLLNQWKSLKESCELVMASLKKYEVGQ